MKQKLLRMLAASLALAWSAGVAAVDELGQGGAGALEIARAVLDLEALGLHPWAPGFHARRTLPAAARARKNY